MEFFFCHVRCFHLTFYECSGAYNTVMIQKLLYIHCGMTIMVSGKNTGQGGRKNYK